eukprot:SAG22_NODE_52_length_24288_cov_15.594568_27_plen_482_part_00
MAGPDMAEAAASADGHEPCCPPSPYRKVYKFWEVLPVIINLNFAAAAACCLYLAAAAAVDFAAAQHEAAGSPGGATHAALAQLWRLHVSDPAAARREQLLVAAVFSAALVAYVQLRKQDRHTGVPPPHARANTGVRTIAVVGAGPSGLVAAKILLAHGYSVVVFESEERVGGTFRYRAYDGAVQVSSKYLTAFTDLRCGEGDEDHLPLPQYLRYLDAYCDKFKLWGCIEFGKRVEDISRRSGFDRRYNSEYVLSLSSSGSTAPPVAEQREFDAVLVCSGLHVTPLKPSIAGIEAFRGEVIHSVEYKRMSQLAGKSVLIIGSGETAMDIAYHGTQPGAAAAVTVSHKNGFLSVPSCLPSGLPLDIYITNLFESAYEHRWVALLHLKWRVATWGIRGAFWLFSGTSGGYNQWGGTKAEVKRGYHFINKSARVIPAINHGACARGFVRQRSVVSAAALPPPPPLVVNPLPCLSRKFPRRLAERW